MPNKINFDIYTESNCCGLLVIGNYEDDGEPNWWLDRRQNSVKRFKTKKQQLEDFDSRLKDDISNIVQDDGNYREGSYLLQTTLVTKYGNTKVAQFPHLAKYLLENGWEINREWKNRNTGNIVTQYQKLLTGEELKDLQRVDDEDTEDDDW